MKSLTNKEKEILLILVKDFSSDYNSNSLSKVSNLTPRGTLKILKNLKSMDILVGKKMGKAVFYKVKLDDEYVFRLISLLLMEESRIKAPRWLSEFKALFEYVEIAVIFGSVVKRPENARDIDLLIVFKRNKHDLVARIINERRKISSRPIHQVKQEYDDLISNMKRKDEVLLNIVKTGIVLQGHEKLVGAIRDVSGF